MATKRRTVYKRKKTARRRTGTGKPRIEAAPKPKPAVVAVPVLKSARKKAAYKKRPRYRKNIMATIAVNITAVAMILIAAIMIYRGIHSSSKKLGFSLDDVATFAIPYSTFQNLNDLSDKYGFGFDELLTFYSLENNFFATEPSLPDKTQLEQTFIINYAVIRSAYDKKQWEPYYAIISTLLEEIVYFPVPTGFGEGEDSYMFGNTWGAAGNHGMSQTHMGTDIVDRENVRGRIPVVSMTDGQVEDIGWHRYDGFRVGIRTTKGTYYYYAHLDSFAMNLEQGSIIRAGDLIGYMGNTGDSKTEGASGNFAVQLHIGISPKTSLAKGEFWINPYSFLRHIESKRKSLSDS